MQNVNPLKLNPSFYCFWFCLFLFSAWPLSAQVALPRTPGNSITQKLNGDEQHIYQLSLAAGEYLNLTVTYKEVILRVVLNDPQGVSLAEWSGGVDTIGDFEAAIVAPVTGNYQLILRGHKTTKIGTYTLELKALRPATEQDQRYANAHQLTLEAGKLYDQRTAESRRQALAKYQEALQLWQLNLEIAKELETLEEICFLHRLLGEPRQGLSIAQQMLTKARQYKLREKELSALRTLGSMYLALGEYQQATQVLEQGLSLSRDLQDRQMEQAVLNTLGVAYASLGQGQTAISFYQQALQVARETGDHGSEAGILNNLATRWNVMGEPEKGMTYYQQALALYRQQGSGEGEVRVLHRLSETQLQRGDFQLAIDYAVQARTLAQKAGNRSQEATALLQLGHIYQVINNPALALTYLAEAKTLYQALENRANEADCFSEMGLVYLSAGEFSKAEELLQQALKIQRTIARKESIITVLMNLGVVFLKQGAPQQGLSLLTEALIICQEIKAAPTEASCLLYISRAQQALGEIEKALTTLQTVLPLAQKLNKRLLEAEVQHDIATIALRQQRYEAAQSASEAALQIIEASRISLIHPEARAIYRSSTQSHYEVYTDVLAQRARQTNDPQLAAQALASVERARARSLLELLTERHVNIRQGVDSELLKREEELQHRLSAKEEPLLQLSAKKNNEEQLKTLQAEINTLTADLRAIESRIRIASPAYAALTHPQPLTLSEIQQQVLDANTLLLEYALGTERSYLFAITPDSLRIFVLPKRAEIETVVRKYYELVEKQNSLPVFSDLASRQKLVTQLEKDSQAVARALSQMLLLPAVAELGQKRLLIVPDGGLQYLPFAALPAPKEEGKSRSTEGSARSRKSDRSSNPGPLFTGRPLILEHEILTLPSASTLCITRKQLVGRIPAPKMLAVLADPVFGTNDERIAAETRGSKNEGPKRLLMTRQEATAIMNLVPATQRMVALDFSANRTLALSNSLSQYRYLHFATHGRWDEKTPELSGLLLSQVDQTGAPQNGYLTIRDVFNLKLSAELVVLSGCQTAKGKELRGEGLAGLTRGFMYAGARRVVASLWQVNDVATAKLMEKFYQGMLGEKQLSPAAALRAAQISMSQDKRWSAPHYWAAFVLQGEW